MPRKFRVKLVAFVFAVAAIALSPGAALAKSIDLQVLSSRPDQVSGGDALVQVSAPSGLLDKLTVERNGEDVTAAFKLQGDGLVGLVDGFDLGNNELTVHRNRKSSSPPADRLQIVDYPTEGPIFSGPHQYPFVCKTIQAGLGEPIVDNQNGLGFRVLNPDGSTAGWSLDCSAAHSGRLPLPQHRWAVQAASLRWLAARRPRHHPAPRWPRRRLRRAPGARHDQPVHLLLRDARALRRGPEPHRHVGVEPKADLHVRRRGRDRPQPGHARLERPARPRPAPGLRDHPFERHRTNTHYNLELGGETALMTKEEFIERYGVPHYTVGLGGSGGAIQQYIYGQNYPGLIDAGIPQRSYPDMVTQTIHVGDCELLEYYMDVTDAANPMWQNWDDREWLIGLNGSSTFPNPYLGGAPGSDECVNGWRGLTPLALNPLFGSAGAGTDRMDPTVMAAVHWTHWDDLKNIYGVGANGYARSTWDNIGVQYGLQALREGKITRPSSST